MKNSKRLKKLILGGLLLLTTGSVFAQTQKVHTLQVKNSSGTTTMNSDALIQMDSDSKGLLLPRIALTGANQVAPLTVHTAGMVVYNTANVPASGTGATAIEAVTPGYYYNDGTKWIKIANTDTADITDDAWVNNTTTNVVELGTKSDGTTVRDANSYFKVADNGKLEIGVSDAVGEVALEFNSTSGSYGFAGSQSAGIGLVDKDATMDVDGQYAAVSFHTGNLNANGDSQIGYIGFKTRGQSMAISNRNDGVDAHVGMLTKGGSLVVYRNGNTGVGTTSVPTHKLDVNGKVRVQDLTGAGTATDVIVTADATTGELKKAGTIANTVASVVASVADATTDAWVNNTTTNVVELGTKSDGTTARDANSFFKVADNGKLEIGVSDAVGEVALEANSTSGNYLLSGNQSANLHLTDKDATMDVDSQYAAITFNAGNPNANGDVQIGYIGFKTNGQSMGITNLNDGVDAEVKVITKGGHLTVYRNGNTGIGTGAPATEKLEVVGNGKFTGTVSTTGVLTTSDKRFKQGITPVTSAMQTVNKLQPVSYTWSALGKKNGGDNKKHIGFIAQEVEKVLPSLVNTNAKGYKSVNYIEVIPVLTKALQEQQKENDDLKQRVSKLEAMVKKLLK